MSLIITRRPGARTTPQNRLSWPGRPAAALRRRWPTGLGITATAAASLLLAVLPDDLAFAVSAWCLLLAAVIYLTWGVRRAHPKPGAGRGAHWLTAQTAAVLAFGAVAITAVDLDRQAGTYLLAAGWLSHAAWDVAHHRLNAVVPRWYAETCLVADVLVATSLLTTTAF